MRDFTCVVCFLNQDQIEDLQNTIERQKKELKKRKDKENSLQTEIDDFREELSKNIGI